MVRTVWVFHAKVPPSDDLIYLWGHAISFACEDTSFYLPEIEEYVGQKLPMGQVRDYLLTEIKHPGKIARYGKNRGGPRGKSDRPRGGPSRGKPRRRNHRKTA